MAGSYLSEAQVVENSYKGEVPFYHFIAAFLQGAEVAKPLALGCFRLDCRRRWQGVCAPLALRARTWGLSPGGRPTARAAKKIHSMGQTTGEAAIQAVLEFSTGTKATCCGVSFIFLVSHLEQPALNSPQNEIHESPNVEKTA